MCCATITGQGNPPGNCGRTISSAAGPPVEVPIRTKPGGGSVSRSSRARDARRARLRGWRTDAGAAQLMPDALAQPQGRADARLGRGAHLLDQHRPQPVDLQGHRAARLGDEIDRAELDRLERRLRAGFRQRRDHHHRPRRLDHDLAETGQARPCPASGRRASPPAGRRSAPARAPRCRCGRAGRRSRLRPGKHPSSIFRISAESSAIEKLDHEACDACGKRLAIELGQYVGFDPVQEVAPDRSARSCGPALPD